MDEWNNIYEETVTVEITLSEYRYLVARDVYCRLLEENKQPASGNDADEPMDG